MLVAKKKSLDYSPRVHVPEQKPKIKPETRKLFHVKAIIVGSIVFVFIVLSLFIAQYSNYVALKLEIDRVKGEIADLQEEKNSLEIEVEKLSSLERIELIALEELGLKYPEEQQWLVLTSR